MPVQPNLHMYV